MSGLCPVYVSYVRSMSGLCPVYVRSELDTTMCTLCPVVSGRVRCVRYVSDMSVLISLHINEGNFIVFLESIPTSWGGLRGWGSVPSIPTSWGGLRGWGSVEADDGGLYPNWGVLT